MSPQPPLDLAAFAALAPDARSEAVARDARGARAALVALGDACERLDGCGRPVRPGFIEELAPDVSHACDGCYFAGPVELFEPGICIGVHEP